jgi:HTH-type transcriptional regulator / antitoxin HigA
MSIALANPVEMIRQGAPRLIHNDKELAEYTRSLFNLTAKANPLREEKEAIELMTLLIDLYESHRFPVPDAEPIDVLRFLLESNNLSQRDIAPEFGSEATVSLVLAGKRHLNRDHIARLSRKFGVSPAVFFGCAEGEPKGKLRVFRTASKGGVSSGSVEPKVVARERKKSAFLRKGA